MKFKMEPIFCCATAQQQFNEGRIKLENQPSTVKADDVIWSLVFSFEDGTPEHVTINSCPWCGRKVNQ